MGMGLGAYAENNRDRMAEIINKVLPPTLYRVVHKCTKILENCRLSILCKHTSNADSCDMMLAFLQYVF